MENKSEIKYGCGSDMELLQYMRGKGNERYNKLDAFCDLFDRITGYKCAGEDDNMNSVLPFQYGQFQASVSQLAETWRWHRATVRSFLDKLEELGYLKKELTGRDYTFYLRLYTGVNVPVKYDENIRTLFLHLLANYDYYDISNEQLAAYLDAYYVEVVKTYQGDNLKADLALHKASLIVEALSDMEYSQCTIANVDEVVNFIASSFESEQNWTWAKWIAALKYLDVALFWDKIPKGEVMEIGRVTETNRSGILSDKDMELLKQIFALVKRVDDEEATSEK